MRGTVKKWGNSQGVRLPKSILEEAHIKENDEVEFYNEDNKIKSEIMCEQMKSLDYKARSPYKVDVLPSSILEEVIEIVQSCF